MPNHRARQRRWWWRRTSTPKRRRRTVELVDARTRLAHLLTPDPLAAGRLPHGRYLALCGADVLPAAMVDPGCGHYCPSCVAPVVPTQRRPR